MKDIKKTQVQPQEQVKPAERIPWKFGLEVKDLTNPITIRRIRILQAGILIGALAFAGYYVWENFLRAPTGVELVNEMVDAAGGAEAWAAIQSGQFTRTQNVYAENGDPLYFTSINLTMDWI